MAERKSHTERREEIIQAAIALVGKGGIQLLTTKNLAKSVNVSEPALYRHFSDKVDVLREVLGYLRERIMDRLREIASSDGLPQTKLENLIRRQFLSFSRRPEIIVVLLSEGLYQNNEELSAIVFSIMQESSVFYTMVIAEGQQSGAFRKDLPAERLAFVVMANLRFCAIQWHLSGRTYDLVEKGEEVLSSVFSLIKEK